MCGIAGIIASNTALVNKTRLTGMTDALAHRGPDGEGHWINDAGIAGFGHRRLSIIDLSIEAAQPMHYLNRYTILHNGEIYNYVELRAALQQSGYTFRTQSDTEVILAAYDHYKAGCLQHFDGMFAFVIWDELEQQLFAARDRFGEKPFYYYFDNKQFVFASEMKALWAAGIEKKMNEKMFFNYFTLGYTQNPDNPFETFYTSICKLPARTYLLFNAATNSIATKAYWDVEMHPANSPLTDDAAIDTFKNILYDSVKKRLRSDVPLGTSLSGGLDSSSVLACIHDITGMNTETFSATFPGFERDESSCIKLAADAFNAGNYQVQPSLDDIISSFETVCYHQEEPFQSSGILAQYSVYGLAKKNNVIVLLDGQGADELLAGYHKYYHWLWQELFRNNKHSLHYELTAAREKGVTEPWNWKNKLAASFPALASYYLKRKQAGQQRNNCNLVKNFSNSFGISYYDIPNPGSLNRILYYNTFLNGLEELLRYADRNSMAHGVEVRLPFLNHELVKFVFSLPAHFKIRDGWTKWLLRKSMEKQLPAEITWRKNKVGFEPPQKQWMENKKLQDYTHEAKKVLVNRGMLKSSVLQKKIQPLDAHAADNYDWKYLVAGTFLR